VIEYITNSFVKDMMDYKAGELCGNILAARWRDGVKVDQSNPSMRLGAFFEYRMTGNLPKDMKPPQPDWLASAKKKPVGERKDSDMTKQYQDAAKHATKALELLKRMGITIKHTGQRFRNSKIMFEADTDIIGVRRGRELIIDAKYSGAGDDRSKYGFGFNGYHAKDQRNYHSIQAQHYHITCGIPFYYLVFGTSGSVRLFKVTFDEWYLDQYVKTANRYRDEFNALCITNDFNATPEYNECIRCPLYNHKELGKCKDRHSTPQPIEIDLFYETE